jgi:hypothetical protein
MIKFYKKSQKAIVCDSKVKKGLKKYLIVSFCTEIVQLKKILTNTGTGQKRFFNTGTDHIILMS